MFTIDNDTNMITIVKKDTAYFGLELDNYVLSQGDKVTFTIAKEKESQDPLVQKVVTDFDEESGIALIHLTSEDTDLDKGTYFYDIQVDTKDGQVDTVIGPAKFKVVEGVTY